MDDLNEKVTATYTKWDNNLVYLLPRLRMKCVRFFFSISIILLLALFANGIYIISKQSDAGPGTEPVPISDAVPRQADARNDKQRVGHTQSSKAEDAPVNIMVLGLDRDETRCDVIMLFHFIPSSSRLSIISAARDTRVLSNGEYTKINALYSKGGEKRVAKELSELTGLPVHYYITVDFRGFRRIVDTLGGVEFYVPFRMNYDDPTQNLHIHLKKGYQVLNGKKAEQLVRYRKGNIKGTGYTEGDIGRIEMQQDFMKALIKQKLNIRYLSRSQDIFGLLEKYVDTNITLADIVRYAGSAAKVKSSEVQTYTIPGTSRYMKGVWYFIHDREKTDEMMRQFF